MRTLTLTADDHRIARLTAAAIAIALVESAVPSPLPGVKPGLANIITLLVLLRYDWVTAAWVTLLRVLAVSLLIGQFLAPGFVLSLGEHWPRWLCSTRHNGWCGECPAGLVRLPCLFWRQLPT